MDHQHSPDSSRTPGSLPIPQSIQTAYWRFRHENTHADVALDDFAAIYRYAATDAMRMSGKLSPQLHILAQLVEFCLADEAPLDHSACDSRIAVLEAQLAISNLNQHA